MTMRAAVQSQRGGDVESSNFKCDVILKLKYKIEEEDEH
jgi:hypothetical protein